MSPMARDPESDPLPSMRISRNTYQFDLRRRYAPVSHYSVAKKAPDNPVARFLEPLLGGAAPRPRPSAAGKGKAAPPPSPLPGLALTVAKAAFACLLLILLAMGWFWLTLSAPTAPPQPPPAARLFNGSLEVRPVEIGLLSVAPPRDQTPATFQPYVLFDYRSRGIQNLSLAAQMYGSPPSRQVFLLRHPRDGADSYNDFRASLIEELRRSGWTLNEVQLSDLRSLPGGCTLVVPTGFLPRALLGLGGVPSIRDLARRGVVVVYIGQPFDESSSVIDSDGSVQPLDAQAAAGALAVNISFERTRRPAPSEAFPLNAPLYTASSREAPSGPVWGPVSGVSYNPGYILLVPQSLDGGWLKQGARAGADIARLVSLEPYRPPLSSASTLLPISDPESGAGRVMLFFNGSTSATAGSARLRFALTDSQGQSESLLVDWPVSKNARGELYFDDPLFIPDYLGGYPKSVTVMLREEANRPAKLLFQLMQNGSVVEQFPVEAGLTPTVITRTAVFSTSAAPGTYILRVADTDGHVMAASRLDVQGVFVNPTKSLRTAFLDGEFAFNFSDLYGRGLSVPHVKAYVENVPAIRPLEASNANAVSYNIGRTGTGNYTFAFDFGSGYILRKEYVYALPKNVWERPEIQALTVFALLVGAVAVFIRPPERLLYSLDIPDFPPQSVFKVEMPISRVLALFEQINRDYAWENMPLKPEELKNGFRKSLHEGKAVNIGDYNLQRLLETLADRHLVEESLGYWAPTAWPRATGVPMRKMAMFRFMRDLFVTNAIRFSKLNALPDCDVKILVGSTEYYLHLYLGDDAIISRALATLGKGRTRLVFKDADELERFEERLQTSAPAAVALKLQIQQGTVKYWTLSRLPDTLKRIKVDAI